MRKLTYLFVLAFVMSLGFTTTGCRDKKSTDEKIEESVEEAGEDMEEAAEEVEDEVEDAVDDAN